jgi:hypothetical protein
VLIPATRHGAALLDQMIDQQAQIIAYNNDFRMMSDGRRAAAAAAVADAPARTAGGRRPRRGGGGETVAGGIIPIRLSRGMTLRRVTMDQSFGRLA